MKCISCNRKDGVIEYLCEECYLRRHPPQLPEQISLIKCKRCGMVRLHGRWTKDTLERGLISFKSDRHSKFRVENVKEGEGCIHVTLVFEGDCAHIQVERSISLRIEYTTCPSCSRQSGGYYEATIQIRGENVSDCVSEIKALIENSNEPNAFITKEIKVRGGVDLLVGSWRVAEQVARAFSKGHGAEFKVSKKLHTRRDNRNVYRMSYLIRLPRIKKGDIFEVDGVPFIFISTSGDATAARNIYTGEIIRLTIPACLLQPLASEDDARDAIVLSESENEIQVLDPDSMKTIDLPKPLWLKTSDGVKRKNLRIIKLKDEWKVLRDINEKSE